MTGLNKWKKRRNIKKNKLGVENTCLGGEKVDLRGWLKDIASLNELARVPGASTELEMGALTDVARELGRSRAILFEDIPGFPKGYRVLTNSMGSPDRFALTVGLPLGLAKKELLKLWSEKIHADERRPPRVVETGAVFENIHMAHEVDLDEFPAPKWHPKDGGRYIGTAAAVVTRGRHDGLVNVGCYRTSIVDRNHLAVYISPGKHGRLQREEYLEAGEPCPVAISFGHHPLVFLAATAHVRHEAEMEEYSWAGGLIGEPLDVALTKIYGLPVPADAEIVVEGKFLANKCVKEGPFGEWTGYYAHSTREVPLLEVESIYHRDNPILLGHPPGKARGATDLYRTLTQSALIKEAIIRAGIPGVKEVWTHEPGGARFFVAVSIHQQYAGHARQAGLVASQCGPGAYMNKYVIVVDEDIDVTDLQDVIWAMATRSDPERSVEILHRCWSGPLDPAIPLEMKGYNSRAIIDCCRPYEWKAQFPEVVDAPREVREAVVSKWGKLLEAR